MKKNQETYRELSIKDGLTQLYNRRFFDEMGHIKANEAKRLNTSLHLVILDVDYFKQFNDQYGHPAGDLALSTISQILRNTFRRPSDFIFRTGGEEFAILTLGDTTANVSATADQIHENLVSENILHETSHIAPYITTSIGTATLNATDEFNFQELYQRADKALYHAKRAGRNLTALY